MVDNGFAPSSSSWIVSSPLCCFRPHVRRAQVCCPCCTALTTTVLSCAVQRRRVCLVGGAVVRGRLWRNRLICRERWTCLRCTLFVVIVVSRVVITAGPRHVSVCRRRCSCTFAFLLLSPPAGCDTPSGNGGGGDGANIHVAAGLIVVSSMRGFPALLYARCPCFVLCAWLRPSGRPHT